MGPAFARFAILGHEAAHKLLFTNKRWNDWVGRWVVAYPSFVPLDAYRRGHFSHHKDEFGPGRARPQPLQRLPDHRGELPAEDVARRARHLGLEEPQGPAARVQEQGRPPHRDAHRRDAAAADRGGDRDRALVALPAAVARPVADVVARDQPAAVDRRARWHDALEGPRQTTHHVRQTWLARFWMVPLNTGWHLAHHVDMGVPWRNLPKLHARARSGRLRHAGAHLSELPRPVARPPLPARPRSYGSTTTGSPWRIVPGSRTQA